MSDVFPERDPRELDLQRVSIHAPVSVVERVSSLAEERWESRSEVVVMALRWALARDKDGALEFPVAPRRRERSASFSVDLQRWIVTALEERSAQRHYSRNKLIVLMIRAALEQHDRQKKAETKTRHRTSR